MKKLPLQKIFFWAGVVMAVWAVGVCGARANVADNASITFALASLAFLKISELAKDHQA